MSYTHVIRNTKNIGIYMQSVLIKLTISSLLGSKRPQEFPFRLIESEIDLGNHSFISRKLVSAIRYILTNLLGMFL